MDRFKQVVRLLDDLEKLPAAAGVQALPSYKALVERKYALAPTILDVRREQPAGLMEGGDFSAAGIASRAAHGFEQAVVKLRDKGFW